MPTMLEVPVWYDFASTLCFVAHRHFQRLQPELDALDLAFRWQPLDLAWLLGWRRGAPVPEERRQNARRVAAELDVEACVPRVWLDSRDVNAAALCLGDGPRAESFRERVFSAVFEEGLPCDAPGACERWLHDLGIAVAETELSDARERLVEQTRSAALAQVTAVPTLMLDQFPFGGVQSEHTTLSMLRRWSSRRREREGSTH